LPDCDDVGAEIFGLYLAISGFFLGEKGGYDVIKEKEDSNHWEVEMQLVAVRIFTEY
jgi:hypothetical protein